MTVNRINALGLPARVVYAACAYPPCGKPFPLTQAAHLFCSTPCGDAHRKNVARLRLIDEARAREVAAAASVADRVPPAVSVRTRRPGVAWLSADPSADCPALANPQGGLRKASTGPIPPGHGAQQRHAPLHLPLVSPPGLVLSPDVRGAAPAGVPALYPVPAPRRKTRGFR